MTCALISSLQDTAEWVRLLNRDPFDLVTWAKIHLADKKMDVGDAQAYNLLVDIQEDLL